MKKLGLFFVTPELGQAIEKARKKKGLTQDDVEALTDCSASNLYLIEKGYKRVKPETIEKLCTFYEIDLSKYQEAPILEEIIDLEDYFQLVELEMRIHPEQAIEMFRQYESKMTHLHGRIPELAVYRMYAKAKQADFSEHYQEAVEWYQKVINEAYSVPEMIQSNILSASYYGMSLMLHFQNNLHGSLRAVEEGLKLFQSNSQRNYLFYMLNIMKASVLEKLNRDTEALQLVESI